MTQICRRRRNFEPLFFPTGIRRGSSAACRRPRAAGARPASWDRGGHGQRGSGQHAAAIPALTSLCCRGNSKRPRIPPCYAPKCHPGKRHQRRRCSASRHWPGTRHAQRRCAPFRRRPGRPGRSSRCTNPTCNASPPVCQSCRAGVMVPRKARKGSFLGCTQYASDQPCTNTQPLRRRG